MRTRNGQAGGAAERESNERYLDSGNHYGGKEKPGARELPRNPQG